MPAVSPIYVFFILVSCFSFVAFNPKYYNKNHNDPLLCCCVKESQIYIRIYSFDIIDLCFNGINLCITRIL